MDRKFKNLAEMTLRGATIAGLVLTLSAASGQAAENVTPHRTDATIGHYQPPTGTWCTDYRLGKLTSGQRLEGRNLERLRAAQAELAPGFEAGDAKTGLALLAAYQDELERRRPDQMTAASYLAQASSVSITDARVRQVNALLCVSTTAITARAIAAEAESERQNMTR